MRRHGRLKKRFIFGGGLLVLFVGVLALSMFAPDYGDNEARAVPAQALNRIAQKNDNAAANAAATMRAKSARDARLADALQDQQDRANAVAE